MSILRSRALTALLLPLSMAHSALGQGLIKEVYGDSSTYWLGITCGGAGDMNGDGYPDIAVGSRGPNNGGTFQMRGTVIVYSGFDGSEMYFFNGAHGGDALGDAIASAGDINRDGYDDLLLGAPGGSYAAVYSGVDGSTLYQWAGVGFGSSASSAGDVNNDTWPDVIVGSVVHNAGIYSGAGRIAVFSGFDGTVLYQIDGSWTQQALGRAVSGGADVDGDGFSDFLASCDKTGPPANLPGEVRVYSGATGAVIYTIPSPATAIGFGRSARFVGDVDSDGKSDIAIGAPDDSTSSNDAGSVRVHSGANGALLYTIDGNPYPGHFGACVAAVGDVNGDGAADVLAGAPATNVFPGYAHILSGLDGSTLSSVTGVKPGFGASVAGLGDTNLDGHLDFIVGDIGWSNNAGRARFFSTSPQLGVSYCTGKVNSLGCVPAISATGLPALSGLDDFHITSSNTLNNKVGIMLWGRELSAAPFYGGKLCVLPPITRTPAQPSGGTTGTLNCSGAYDFHFSQAYMVAELIFAGDTIYAQYWARDPGWSPPNNSSLSNGWTFTVGQ